MSKILHIGIDAGGSKIDIAGQLGASRETRMLPSVNARMESVESTAQRLAAAATVVVQSMSATSFRLCAGVAGVASEDAQRALQKLLAVELAVSMEHIEITSDARIAFQAAFSDDTPSNSKGILVISGTGSGCYSFSKKGQFFRTGGWGSTLGDPGSGTQLGIDAIRHTLECQEAGNSTELSRSVQQALHSTLHKQPVAKELTVADILDVVYHSGFKPASLAPVLLNCAPRSEEARQLVANQCESLALQVKRLSRQLDSDSPRIALAGGLSQHEVYANLLTTSISDLLPLATLGVSLKNPVEGALDLAQKMN